VMKGERLSKIPGASTVGESLEQLEIPWASTVGESPEQLKITTTR